mgnify:CR=1 FL=1|tara:strand:- start:391 stop:1062 length:672 start_codon:yes stop_codon:yes gene_type:complete
MAISRNIRSIWITDYDKSIGSVADYLASGSGSDPFYKTADPYSTVTHNLRSTITGVTEITTGGYFWGQSEWSVGAGSGANLDEDLTAGETTIETTDGNAFAHSGGGYIIIEEEIIHYAAASGITDNLTGCTRGALNTTDVQHDGTASTIPIYIYQRGVVQSINYDEDDEVYAVRVALGAGSDTPETITSYYVYRFEFPKSVIDLVNYEDVENPTTINGTIPGY